MCVVFLCVYCGICCKTTTNCSVKASATQALCVKLELVQTHHYASLCEAVFKQERKLCDTL